MSKILNYDTDTSASEVMVYRDNGTEVEINEQILNADFSTVTEQDVEIMQSLSQQAAGYAAKIAKKKKHYDFRTKNESFRQLYLDLKRKGIKNNKFFLQIYDTDLIGIDPYSPVLPKEIQMKIYIECLINPWYWLREILRIPEDGTPIEPGGGTQYRIDRNNAACWYLALNGIGHYQSKPRQTGKTQDCLAKFNYAYHFGSSGATILFFHKDQDGAIANLYRLKCQRDMMPTWLQARAIMLDNGKFDKGINNARSIRNPLNNNEIRTMGKATSRDSAMLLGRGATAALQYYDEFDFIPYQTEILRATSLAYATAADNARKNASMAFMAFSSTPETNLFI